MCKRSARPWEAVGVAVQAIGESDYDYDWYKGWRVEGVRARMGSWLMRGGTPQPLSFMILARYKRHHHTATTV